MLNRATSRIKKTLSPAARLLAQSLKFSVKASVKAVNIVISHPKTSLAIASIPIIHYVYHFYRSFFRETAANQIIPVIDDLNHYFDPAVDHDAYTFTQLYGEPITMYKLLKDHVTINRKYDEFFEYCFTKGDIITFVRNTFDPTNHCIDINEDFKEGFYYTRHRCIRYTLVRIREINGIKKLFFIDDTACTFDEGIQLPVQFITDDVKNLEANSGEDLTDYDLYQVAFNDLDDTTTITHDFPICFKYPGLPDIVAISRVAAIGWIRVIKLDAEMPSFKRTMDINVFQIRRIVHYIQSVSFEIGSWHQYIDKLRTMRLDIPDSELCFYAFLAVQICLEYDHNIIHYFQ